MGNLYGHDIPTMQRRSTAISGCVTFPVTDSAWRNTQEGGMFVKLVVCDNRDFEGNFGMCCGVQVTDQLSEVLIGDDQRPRPASPESYDSVESVTQEQRALVAWMRYHYPFYDDDSVGVEEQYASRNYLASLVLGTTGWSGWHNETKAYWTCTVADLNESGQALYRQLVAQYPGCEVHLLTFLDT